jgi:hypothetical protein
VTPSRVMRIDGGKLKAIKLEIGWPGVDRLVAGAALDE